jgi:ribosomal protein S18 acetylase RimI-like enzyme
LSYGVALDHLEMYSRNFISSVIGKAEGQGTEWHGHITAVTVAPEYRRVGVARRLINYLETVSQDIYQGYFVDLYVRCANYSAMDMYEGSGYSVYRRVKEYYGSLGLGKGSKDEEDAFGTPLIFWKIHAFHSPINRHAQTLGQGSSPTVSPPQWA